ncbi:MAG: MFS transporter [Candidatus Methylomirabilales bacterium]
MPARPRAKDRDFAVVTTAQFFMAFSLNFLFVFLPFYIQHVSTMDAADTLRWTGLIVGGASAAATVGSTFWGGLTDRFSPKALFERGILSHAVLVALMGFTTDVRLLLLIRLVQGFMGGISTIGLIIVSAVSQPEELPRRMGAYQSALTLGQIFSPPLGALAAAAFGFRGAFLASSSVLFCVFLFSRAGLSHLAPVGRAARGEAVPRRQLLLAWSVAFAGTIQIVFLPSVLPEILRGFQVPEARQLLTAGVIVFAYGVSAAAGSYGFSRLASRVPARRLLLLAAGGAAGCQLLLIAGVEPVSFTLLRMAQTALAAGIFPLILAEVAARGRGRTIGFINMARFAGNAAGPVIATFILAHTDLLALYATLAAGLVAPALAQHVATRGGRPPHPEA